MPPGQSTQSFSSQAKLGCYLVNIKSEGANVEYWGTLRLDDLSGYGLHATADLYTRPLNISESQAYSFPAPDPAAGIPCFPRLNFNYYWKLKSISEEENNQSAARLTFSRKYWSREIFDWVTDGNVSIPIERAVAPENYPDPDHFYRGTFTSSTTGIVYIFEMGWISEFFRKAIVELVSESELVPPTGDGASRSWQMIGREIGWEIETRISTLQSGTTPPETWTLSGLHREMEKFSQGIHLDQMWHYYILCVSRIDDYERGVMFDIGYSDLNMIPREGAATAASWKVPDLAKWAPYRKKNFGDASPFYFRTAVHEWGHTCNLEHEELNSPRSFMATTDTIAAQATSTNAVIDVARFSFRDSDQISLKHSPDIQVRPGGPIPFLHTDASDRITEMPFTFESKIQFTAVPVNECIPLGTPARFDLVAHNHTQSPISVPTSLSFKGACLEASVTQGLHKRKVHPAIIRADQESANRTLKPGEKLFHGVTLFFGDDGPLFPSTGFYEIAFLLDWVADDTPIRARASASILVTGPPTKKDSHLALRNLQTPEVFLVLLLGGDHLKRGMKCVQDSLKSKSLAPHFQYIEARRRCDAGQSFGTTDKARVYSSLIDRNTQLNREEIRKINLIANRARPRSRKEEITSLRSVMKTHEKRAAERLRIANSC